MFREIGQSAFYTGRRLNTQEFSSFRRGNGCPSTSRHDAAIETVTQCRPGRLENPCDLDRRQRSLLDRRHGRLRDREWQETRLDLGKASLRGLKWAGLYPHWGLSFSTNKKARPLSRSGLFILNPAASYSPIERLYSTIGAGGLNGRVRDGIGCDTSAVATGNCSVVEKSHLLRCAWCARSDVLDSVRLRSRPCARLAPEPF
jgi:hypothetical protein